MRSFESSRPTSLATHLGERLLPVYLVSGDEPLLAAEAADAVRCAGGETPGFTEREVHFIERAGRLGRGARLRRQPCRCFAARRVMEIRLGQRQARHRRQRSPGRTGSEAHDPDTLFLILAPRLDRDAQGADWVRAVEATAPWVQIWPVDPQRLVAWLKGRCRRLRLEASDEALELLAARTEGNLLAAHQELTKLTLLAPGGRVTADAVLAAVAASARL